MFKRISMRYTTLDQSSQALADLRRLPCKIPVGITLLSLFTVTMQGMMLLTKKSITKLGTQMNENAASKPSNFAMRQMEKMGWTEGKGLGKTESGISTHLTITKRDDSTGLGSEAVEARANDSTETWWHDGFAANLKLLQKKSKGKKSKSGDSKKNDDGEEQTEAKPSYDDLFKATGGARLGMRARADQKGKLKRTEDQMSSKIGTDGLISTASVSTASAQVTVGAEGATTASSDSETVQKPAKKAKKAKSDKKDKDDTTESLSAEDKMDKKEKRAKKEKKSKKDRK